MTIIDNKNRQNKLIRSFGRIKSRKLSSHKNNLLENLMPRFLINNFNQLKEYISRNNLNNSKKILEIGYGFGDFLFANLSKNPSNFFIGGEPHINGVVSLLAMIEVAENQDNWQLQSKKIDNLKIYNGDIREIITNADDGFFDEFYILFPDPWPKNKHHRRRIINKEFLNLLAIKSSNNAKITIATDDDGYKKAITIAILQNQYWQWQVKSKADWQEFPQDWTVTKYQRKAMDAGRRSVIFSLSKAGC